MAKDKSLEGQQMTYEEFMALERQREELKTRNKVEFSGLVTEVSALDVKAKTDKQGNVMLDENKQPTFYDPLFWISIATMGSEEGALLSAEQVGDIEVGKYYLFAGRLKNRKFKVEHTTLI